MKVITIIIATFMALVANAADSGVKLGVEIGGFDWVPSPWRPCDEKEIKWIVHPWPIPNGTIATAHLDTCTIVSGYTEDEAKRMHADGSGLISSESVWTHERRHLLTGMVHPRYPRIETAQPWRNPWQSF